MNERWFLFYDGACPLCTKLQSKLVGIIQTNVRLTTIDLNGKIAKLKGYTGDKVVLETPGGVFFGIDVWIHILSKGKYKFATHILFRPILVCIYWLVSRNRKLLSTIIK
jgi:predicted DCC family thiol-disulfide oxidoreductase YuxK